MPATYQWALAGQTTNWERRFKLAGARGRQHMDGDDRRARHDGHRNI